MKSNNINIILLLVLIFSLSFFSCSKKSDEEHKSISTICDTVNKIDLLLRDILSKKCIYSLVRDDTVRFNYLIANKFIKPGEIYIGYNSIPILSVEKDSIVNKNASQIYISDAHFNYDTSSANLEVEYRLMGKMFEKRVIFNYLFDVSKCKWIVKDSTIFEH